MKKAKVVEDITRRGYHFSHGHVSEGATFYVVEIFDGQQLTSETHIETACIFDTCDPRVAYEMAVAAASVYGIRREDVDTSIIDK